MHLVRWIPLFAPVLLVYAACMPFIDFGDPVAIGLLSFALPSGALVSVKTNELFLIGVTLVLFFEIVKAAAVTPGHSWVEHIFSTFVFVGFLVMFLVVPAAGNSTFLIVTMMSLIDVLAGWTISYRAALRDVGFGVMGVHGDH